jgi:NhaP-type Na+/H+ or K+/H+ antiporter
VAGDLRSHPRCGPADRPRAGSRRELNWTGLRGAVATALALSIPEGTSDREVLQGIAFGIVLFTLIVQGTTAEPVLRWAGVHADETSPSGTVG